MVYPLAPVTYDEGTSSVSRLRLLSAVLMLCAVGYPVAEAKVVGAAVMPHGGIALDPSHFKTNNITSKHEAELLNKACIDVGLWVGSLQPDLIVLSTPHGIADLNNFVFYLNSKGFGWADTDNCGCPPCCYNVSITIDKVKSTDLVKQLKLSGASVSGLVGFGDATSFPLAWGEVIPLHFLTPHVQNTTKVMVISQPERRYTDSVSMIPELLQLGKSMMDYFDLLTSRVVVVISGDMAHTHLPDGPYGYSNASQPFDNAVGEWASSLNSTSLLQTAAKLVDKALSCGYTGLVMLHGFMSAIGIDKWTPHLLANYHPSYYGMLIASFTTET